MTFCSWSWKFLKFSYFDAMNSIIIFKSLMMQILIVSYFEYYWIANVYRNVTQNHFKAFISNSTEKNKKKFDSIFICSLQESHKNHMFSLVSVDAEWLCLDCDMPSDLKSSFWTSSIFYFLVNWLWILGFYHR